MLSGQAAVHLCTFGRQSVCDRGQFDRLRPGSDDDKGTHPVKTVGGCEFTAMYKDGVVMIKDGMGNVANVTIADVKQSNGVIHVIDTVLLPAM